MTLIPTLAAVVLMAGSCSIKEDRSECPCWLKVFIDPFPASGAVISAWNGSPVFLDMVEEGDWTDFYEATVPRGFLGVTCFRHIPSLDFRDGVILIGCGHEADSLYAHHATVDCTGETAIDRASLHKQFSTVYMSFKDTGDGEDFPYDVKIRGGVDGMDMSTLEPHPGEFLFAPQEVAPLRWQFRVPRQKDSSLMLDLYRKGDGGLADSLPLGLYIAESGFDWEAESLEDIVITVDFAKADLEVTVSEWNADTVYDITI